MGESEPAYLAQVEIFPKREVGDDPQVAATNRQLSGVFSDRYSGTAVERIGRLVELEVTATDEAIAGQVIQGLMDTLLVNPISEEGTYELELKPPDEVELA